MDAHRGGRDHGNEWLPGRLEPDAPLHPAWRPHAKFHDAWTVLLGTGLGVIGLYLLWKEADPGLAAVLSALFWGARAGSFAFPGIGGFDSEFPDGVPRVAGVRMHEAAASAAMLALT